MEIADLMTKPMPNSSQSLLDMGFEYLILDDGWAATARDENGDIIPGKSLIQRTFLNSSVAHLLFCSS
jgi:hypothetical protein